MKKYSLAFSVLLLTFAVMAFGVANQAHAFKSQEQTVQGTISSVDADGGELKVKNDDGDEKSLKISPSTKISKGGKEIKLADIKVGDKIQAVVEEGAVKEIEVAEG
ncbi:MAG: hypothetical protein J2P31_03805 [Blastocatellia bacterium]|nr:hypothetical protein [Blastocatellia bacterium]